MVSGNGLRVYPKGKIPASRDVPEGGFVTSVGNWKLKERLHKKRGSEKAGNSAGQGVPGRKVSDAELYLSNRNLGLGHVAVKYTGMDKPVGERPAAGAPLSSRFTDNKAVYGPEDPAGFSKVYVIPTTHEQDIAGRKYIEKRMENPGRYNMFDDSCVNAACDALRAGGVRVPTEPKMWPNSFMRQIEEMNRGELKDVLD